MIVLSWNCRGLGIFRAVLVLRDLVRVSKSVIFLSETIVHAVKVKELRVKFDFEFFFSVDCEGRGDGQTLIWRSRS